MLGLRELSWFSVSVSWLVSLAAIPAPTLSTKPTWPYDLPPHVKHFPGDEKLVQKRLEVQERIVLQRPQGLLKMSPDEGEMFFPEYWRFDPDEHPGSGVEGTEGDMLRGRANASIGDLLEAPLKVHNFDQDRQVRPPSVLDWLPRMPRGLLTSLNKREFQCPGDTLSCTEIDRPNSCCPIGGTCQLIYDSKYGDVGCCQKGQTCSQQVVGCLNGYTSCPTSSGGGCCIPGYECLDVGCVLITTATVVVIPTVTLVRLYTPTALPSLKTTSSSAPSPSSSTITTSSSSIAIAITTTTSTLYSSASPTTLTCSPGYRSCAPSLGGGCCATDRQCGPSTCPPYSSAASSSSTSDDLNYVIPVRPTSNAITTITAASIATYPNDICPTGFYQCSAYYHGGCCRVGRDCDLTSCPSPATTTVANTNGVVILGLEGSGTASPSGSGSGSGSGSAQGTGKGTCAQYWYECAQGAGGGCCPTGYACGQSCTATASDITATVTGTAAVRPKVAVSGASTTSIVFPRRWIWIWEWKGGVWIMMMTVCFFGGVSIARIV